jgi:hypothetical protein
MKKVLLVLFLLPMISSLDAQSQPDCSSLCVEAFGGAPMDDKGNRRVYGHISSHKPMEQNLVGVENSKGKSVKVYAESINVSAWENLKKKYGSLEECWCLVGLVPADKY